METKREKFIRLAEKRTNVVIERIRVLSNCANPYAYEYTEDDIQEVFSAIDGELKKARTRFQNGATELQREFRLSSRPYHEDTHESSNQGGISE